MTMIKSMFPTVTVVSLSSQGFHQPIPSTHLRNNMTTRCQEITLKVSHLLAVILVVWYFKNLQFQFESKL